MGLSGVSHFLKSSVDMAVIKFVVAAYVSDLALERVICPFYATGPLFRDSRTSVFHLELCRNRHNFCIFQHNSGVYSILQFPNCPAPCQTLI